ncbi:MAG: TAXI family TRAP transporter solute-binding subunit [Alphaproteobacteria bacterium]|nr:MAG: TAXI family TRAP transporter solute-binding subunit [Alphaproteobacteria bacterium]
MTRHAGTLLAALALGLGLAHAAAAQRVGIATSNPGSLFHSIGTAVANAANHAGLNVTVQPATSPNQFLPLLNAGGIEFGVSNMQEVAYAHDGKAWFSGNPNPNLRVVAMLMPLREAIFVRADSDIRTIADLKGKRITDGYTAQNTIPPQIDAILATAGLTRADTIPVNVPSVVAGADAFMAGEADAFIFAHGAAKVREADAAVGGLRALPISDTSPEALARARQHWPAAFFVEMKAGSSPGVLEDGVFFAFDQVIVTHAGVPDEIVYAMAKAIHDGKEIMRQTFPPFAAFDPKKMKGDALSVGFHPGALKFFADAGIE